MSSNCPRFGVQEVLSRAVKDGFAGFEPRIGWNHRHGIEPGAPAAQLAEIRRAFADADVAIPCIATGIHTGVPPERRAEQLETLKQCIALAQAVGAAYLRVFGGGPREIDEQTRVGYSAETLAQAADIAGGSGVMPLLETHDFFRAGRLVGQVLDLVDRPEIGILWDIGHPVSTGEPLETTIAALKLGRVRHLHVNDSFLTPKAGGGYDRADCNDYGQGDLPLAAADRALSAAGFSGIASLERIFKPDDESHDAAAFLAHLAAGMHRVHG